MKFKKQVVNGINYNIIYRVDGGKQIIVSVHRPLRYSNSNEVPSVKSVKAYQVSLNGGFSKWKNVEANSTELEFFQGLQYSAEHVSGENYT